MEKVYVDDTNRVAIICPKCKSENKVDVTHFKDTNKKLKAKCQCGKIFRLTLDFRKHYRKNVRFLGEYIIQGKDEKGEIIVENISAGGIKFSSLKPHFISNNDIVELKFTLDNPMQMEIRTLVRIIWTIDRDIGSQYVDPKSNVWDFICKHNLF